MPPRPNLRVWTLQLALLGWAALVVTRLFWLQVVDYAWLTHRAQHQQRQTVAVAAQRGAIYDRNLLPLAMSLDVESVFAVPASIPDPAATARQLAPVLHLDPAPLAARLRSPRSFLWIQRRLTAAQSDAIARLRLPGVFLQPETQRFYPKGGLAANVLGYVGLDGTGLGGVERAYDGDIRGREKQAVLEVDAHRQGYAQLPASPSAAAAPAADSGNLVLTLDQNIQFIAQQELDRRVAETHAAHGVAIVENPRTGEILALADSPSFDPNEVASTPADRLGDAAVSDVYEPGSVFKLVTLSAALQEGLTTPDEMIDCQNGSIRLGGRTIHDHQAFGVLSVTDILTHSSDVGAIKVGLRLGDQRFYDYIRAYGFGQPTGIHLPGESRGVIRPPQKWTPMSIGALSMGQEIAVTPMQVISLISTLADDGVYHAPRIVRYAGVLPPELPDFAPAPPRRVVSPLVANEMKQMMAQVVLRGTAQQAQLNGYTSAGKTGTAQKVDAGTHLYSATHFVSSFGGFAPINDPAITILVVIDSPQGGHEGGPTAGPVFKRIAERVLPYLGVPEDIPENTPARAAAIAAIADNKDSVDESQPLSKRAVLDDAEDSDPAPAPVSAPPAADPSAALPSAGLIVMNYPGRLDTIVAPDFTGQSVRAVSRICQRLGLDPRLEGNGTARQQLPAPGARLAPGARITVRFTP